MKKFILTLFVALAVISSSFANQYARQAVSVKDYGPMTSETINDAITAAGTTDVVLLLNQGTWSITNDVTVPSNVTLLFDVDAIFDIDLVATVTFNGCTIDADHMIFTGAGSIAGTVGNDAKQFSWIGASTMNPNHTTLFADLRAIGVGATYGGMFMVEQIEIQGEGGFRNSGDSESIGIYGGETWSGIGGAYIRLFGAEFEGSSAWADAGDLVLNAGGNTNYAEADDAGIIFLKSTRTSPTSATSRPYGWMGLAASPIPGYDMYRWVFLGPVNISGDGTNALDITEGLVSLGTNTSLEVNGESTFNDSATFNSNSVFNGDMNGTGFSNSVVNVVTNSSDITTLLTPAGTVLASFATATPDGYLYCDGTSYETNAYPTLYAAIGYSCGSTNAAWFNVPDLRGRFLRGQDDDAGRDPDVDSRTAMNPGGNSTNDIGSVQLDAFESHQHNMTDGSTSEGVRPVLSESGTVNDNYLTDATGASTETRPLNAYVRYYIKY